MALTHPQPLPEDPTAIAVADPDAAQRAAETNAAVILMVCLLALVGGTQLLVAFLGQLA
ncbi:MAG TPA: hypothetical protein VFK43_04360 [Acidimicrobiales bacterium]|nr:hypothetical protein [Acidimicrobiales bacterium]